MPQCRFFAFFLPFKHFVSCILVLHMLRTPQYILYIVIIFLLSALQSFFFFFLLCSLLKIHRDRYKCRYRLRIVLYFSRYLLSVILFIYSSRSGVPLVSLFFSLNNYFQHVLQYRVAGSKFSKLSFFEMTLFALFFFF